MDKAQVKNHHLGIVILVGMCQTHSSPSDTEQLATFMIDQWVSTFRLSSQLSLFEAIRCSSLYMWSAPPVETSTEINQSKAALQVVFFTNGAARASQRGIVVKYKEDLEAARNGTQDKGLPVKLRRSSLMSPSKLPLSQVPRMPSSPLPPQSHGTHWRRIGITVQGTSAIGQKVAPDSRCRPGHRSPSARRLARLQTRNF